MLVLTRKTGQAIQIGDGVTVKVLRVTGNQVRIGIAAPDSCRILRAELAVALDDLAFHDSVADMEVPIPG